MPQPNQHGALAGATTQPAARIAATAQPKLTPVGATPAVAEPGAVAQPAVAHGNGQLPTALHLSGDPNELVGLDHAAVRRALGDPALVRTELSAQVWQYVTGDCVVDLYLYSLDGALKVTYVEARSHSAETAPTARCLKSLLERPTASAN